MCSFSQTSARFSQEARHAPDADPEPPRAGGVRDPADVHQRTAQAALRFPCGGPADCRKSPHAGQPAGVPADLRLLCRDQAILPRPDLPPPGPRVRRRPRGPGERADRPHAVRPANHGPTPGGDPGLPRPSSVRGSELPGAPRGGRTAGARAAQAQGHLLALCRRARPGEGGGARLLPPGRPDPAGRQPPELDADRDLRAHAHPRDARAWIRCSPRNPRKREGSPGEPPPTS